MTKFRLLDSEVAKHSQALVRHMSNLSDKKSRRFIASSLQIRLEAEQSDLNIIDENQVMNIQVLFDGADQIDSEYHMIKGGGGALFREKILFEAATEIGNSGRVRKVCQQT